MCLAQWPQRSDAGKARTRDLLISSQHSTTEPLRSIKIFYFSFDLFSSYSRS